MSAVTKQGIRVQGAGATWSVDIKPWDTEFFARPIGSLTWDRQEAGIAGASATRDELRDVVDRADRAGFSMVECHVDIADFAIAPALEDVGFRLVDSRIQFLTRFTTADIPDERPTHGDVLDADPSHRERILEIIRESFTRNDQFLSRFKNTEYFTLEEAERYYEAWFDNTAFEPDAATAVFVVDGAVMGFYTYQARERKDGLPVMKATLTAVDAQARGMNAHVAMQARLYRKLSSKLGCAAWYVDNTTQLANTPVIWNHIASGKRPEAIRLTFLRRNEHTARLAPLD